MRHLNFLFVCILVTACASTPTAAPPQKATAVFTAAPTTAATPSPKPSATSITLSATPVPTTTSVPSKTPTTDPEISITGFQVPQLTSYDRLVTALMKKWNVPGGAVAVVKDGRLIFAHGYGLADKEQHVPVQPTSLFRIASLSKPFTAAGILKLVERGQLSLDAKAFSIINQIKSPSGAINEPLRNITIRQLLQHTAGWDREQSFDPMFAPQEIAQAVGAPPPASAATVISYMLTQSLQFEPGTQFAYSNFGYAVLGRIIEKVSGTNYESYIKSNILQPINITRMKLGHTLLSERAKDEVIYYDYPNAVMEPSVVNPTTELVPNPYGGFYMEAMDAHGGWIASTIDLVRFINALDGRPRSPSLLKPETIRLMTARPAPPLPQNEPTYYAMGWMIRPVGQEANWWHAGGLAGSATIMVRAYNGLTWAAMFNTLPKEATKFQAELDEMLWQAADGVTVWPTQDLFANYP